MKKSSSEIIDILSSEGIPTGKTASVDKVRRKGLWYYGVHALILTPSGRMVVQKRSNSMLLNPSKLEIGAGGLVVSGETCLQAIKREIKEELGLVVKNKDISLVKITKWNRRHLRTRTYTRSFLYTYIVLLDTERPEFLYQKSETSYAFIATFNQVKRMVYGQKIRSLGGLAPMYGYWRMYLHLADEFRRPTIHIVCRGNRFRSRIAQAYLRSKAPQPYRFSSSGIDVALGTAPNSSLFTNRLMKKHKLFSYAQNRKYQTYQEMLDVSSLVVFVSPTVYSDAARRYVVDQKKSIIWNIQDVTYSEMPHSPALQTKLMNKIYSSIKTDCDALIKKLPDLFPQVK